MGYFNYHATAKRLIKEGKLIGYEFAKNHNGIKNALLLFFNDPKHPVMPIRPERVTEYLSLINRKNLT